MLPTAIAGIAMGLFSLDLAVVLASHEPAAAAIT